MRFLVWAVLSKGMTLLSTKVFGMEFCLMTELGLSILLFYIL